MELKLHKLISACSDSDFSLFDPQVVRAYTELAPHYLGDDISYEELFGKLEPLIGEENANNLLMMMRQI